MLSDFDVNFNSGIQASFLVNAQPISQHFFFLSTPEYFAQSPPFNVLCLGLFTEFFLW